MTDAATFGPVNTIQVALVNDYEVVVQGLASMLRSYERQVRVVELDANKNVDASVDIALYDTFAGAQGDSADVRELVTNPGVGRVVIYSWNLDSQLITAALGNGASGYLSKALTARRLVDALLAVHRGEQIVSPAVQREEPAVTGGDWPGREEGLTARESEVLALITQGLSNAQIADRAALSINSIKTYIRSCYRRIGVTTRPNAILWGIEHGFRPDRTRIHEPDLRLQGQ